MNKKMLIGLGIGVGVVAVVGLVIGGVALFRKNHEPDDIDDEEDDEDFPFDDYLEVESDVDIINDTGDIEIELYPQIKEKIERAGYMSSDFTEEQLRGLSYSFDQGYDITQVVNPGYNGDQMVAIASGINNGYDPEYFANPELSHKQILKIIQGLGHNVDVTKYNNPNYSEEQMTSILVGLLAGVDIDELFKSNKLVNLGNPLAMRQLIFNKIISDGKNPNTYLDDLAC